MPTNSNHDILKDKDTDTPAGQVKDAQVVEASDNLDTIDVQSEAILKEDVQPPEEAVLHAPDKELEDIKRILEDLKNTKVPYSELSRLKQKRALKKANKILKAEGMKPVTHKEMLAVTSWDGLVKVDQQVTKSVVVTMTTVDRILNHPDLPEDFKGTDSFNSLQRYCIHGTKLMSNNLDIARGLLLDDDGAVRKGGVQNTDMAQYTEAFDVYNQIRTDLVQLLGYISDPISILLSAIKLNNPQEEKSSETDKVPSDMG